MCILHAWGVYPAHLEHLHPVEHRGYSQSACNHLMGVMGTSIRSSSAGGMGSVELAVATKSTWVGGGGEGEGEGEGSW